jgi:hypothetical protein
VTRIRVQHSEVIVGQTSRQRLLSAAALLSLLAALIHVWVMPEHFEEWWGYGLFFLVAAAAQALFAVVVLKAPTQAVFAAGIVGNVAIIVLWAYTRTVGIPLGPHAGEVEAVGAIDVVSKFVELALALVLAVLLRHAPRSTRVSMSGAH